VEEMLDAALTNFEGSDVSILSAAVADYRPKEISLNKINKDNSELKIDLIKTPYILATLGKLKKKGQILVGFALETDNEEENAIKKLEKKNLDFIVLNSLRDEGAGFRNDYNKITIIDRKLNKEIFELKPKTEVAEDICKKVLDLLR
jgi:phosphopantothenoylcysteine decarboxylase/phosphopantothenate--cysteine ligase